MTPLVWYRGPVASEASATSLATRSSTRGHVPPWSYPDRRESLNSYAKIRIFFLALRPAIFHNRW